MKKAATVRKKRRPNRKRRSETKHHGPGNYHARMHRSESSRQTGFALHVFPKQEEPANAEAARKEKIQSLSEKAHASPRNQVTRDATKNCQTPLRFSSRQSDHATAPDRHRRRSDRLQEPRSPQKIRHRKRQDSSPPRHRNACAHASQDHPRDQAQPFGLADEVM